MERPRTTGKVFAAVAMSYPAFDGDARAEVARIFADAARRIAAGDEFPVPLFDKDGHRVGEVGSRAD